MHRDSDLSNAPAIVAHSRTPFSPGDALLIPADAYKPTGVRWLWHGRVPVGKVTLIAGDPGLGKSFVTLDLAARTSTGRASPHDTLRERDEREGIPPESPGDVVLLNAEDDPADTLRPRLEAMGADLERIHILDGIHGHSQGRWSNRAVELDRDLHRLDNALCQLRRPRLLVVDPISAFLGQADSHSNAQVRALLGGLSRLAQKHDCAIVCVSHLNKGGAGQRAVYRAMGSLAFTAAARVVLLVAKHPEDESLRIVVPVKCNLSGEAPALAYRIVQRETGAGVEAVIEWGEAPLSITADQIERNSAPESPTQRQRGEALNTVCDWLTDLLASGPVRASEVHERAGAEAIAPTLLLKARKQLNVNITRTSVPGGERGEGHWTWSLAGEPEPHASNAAA
jgi:KaiC/GvpD/RAD55 family RecA-like ATPase